MATVADAVFVTSNLYPSLDFIENGCIEKPKYPQYSSACIVGDEQIESFSYILKSESSLPEFSIRMNSAVISEVPMESASNETFSQPKEIDECDLPPFLVHKLDRLNDTLLILSLMYTVSIDDLKKANAIISKDDSLDFYENDTMIIPGPKSLPKTRPIGILKEEHESRMKEAAQLYFQRYKNVNEFMAKFYLETNNYDYKAAVKEFEEDEEWELEEKARKDKAKKRREQRKLQMKKRRESRQGRRQIGILSLISMCIPISLSFLKRNHRKTSTTGVVDFDVDVDGDEDDIELDEFDNDN